MSTFQATDSRGAYDALAAGEPLAALQAHATLLQAPRGTADLDGLWSFIASGDRLARALAIRPLARLAGRDFDRTLSALAGDDDLLLREQALWALADRPATPKAIAAAIGALAEGGHAAMLAQLTIERWAASDPAVLAAIPAALADHAGDDARVRLVETAAVADHPGLATLLTRLLRSTDEPEVVRAAAARGLAAHPNPTLLGDLWRLGADGGPELRFACARALLALRSARAGEAAAALATTTVGSSEPFDRLLAALVRGRSATPPPTRPGLRIAQIFMQGRLDGELKSAGAGDGGGISTLLVHLGRALGSEPEIAHVVTIARALAEPETGWGHTRLSEAQSPGVSIERVPFGPAGYLPAAAMWEHRLELERALEAAITELGGVDVAHLRFADAGSFAAARVCRRLGIPVAFTAAPDPHGVIDGAERRGELTRATFPAAERGPARAPRRRARQRHAWRRHAAARRRRRPRPRWPDRVPAPRRGRGRPYPARRADRRPAQARRRRPHPEHRPRDPGRELIDARLLDQRVLAGAGNIFRAEALFLTAIDPLRPAAQVPADLAHELWETIRTMMHEGVRLGRIVTRDPAELGLRSRRTIPRPDALYVYKRQTCLHCSGTIARATVGGRSLYWCPRCQS